MLAYKNLSSVTLYFVHEESRGLFREMIMLKEKEQYGLTVQRSFYSKMATVSGQPNGDLKAAVVEFIYVYVIQALHYTPTIFWLNNLGLQGSEEDAQS